MGEGNYRVVVMFVKDDSCCIMQHWFWPLYIYVCILLSRCYIDVLFHGVNQVQRLFGSPWGFCFMNFIFFARDYGIALAEMIITLQKRDVEWCSSGKVSATLHVDRTFFSFTFCSDSGFVA